MAAFAAEPSAVASITATSAAHATIDRLRLIGGNDPCVDVAHSMGGVVATLAAEHAPGLFSHIVYVAAVVPVSGIPAGAYIGSEENAGERGTALSSQTSSPQPGERPPADPTTEEETHDRLHRVPAREDHRPGGTRPLRERSDATFVGHEVEALVDYGLFEVLEGPSIEGVVILRFPDADAATVWYRGEEYQEVVQDRFRGAAYRAVLVEGADPG